MICLLLNLLGAISRNLRFVGTAKFVPGCGGLGLSLHDYIKLVNHQFKVGNFLQTSSPTKVNA